MSAGDEDDIDAQARMLVDEALQRFEGKIPPELTEQIRLLLEVDLVATQEGRGLLRSAMSDPSVDHSGDVLRVPESSRAKAGGSK